MRSRRRPRRALTGARRLGLMLDLVAAMSPALLFVSATIYVAWCDWLI